ncbi:MAG TPA: hypothetical protein VMW27_20080, partial [Thermoanaerobaculia bacterium]|nr:hypothetical protein [Thermoanaerobaculia bacterium]
MLSRRLLPALLLLCAPLWAGENVWTPIGPEGGTVRSLAIAPNGRTAYAGTTTGQVFRSADAGRAWTLTAPNLGGAVLQLEADPFQAGRIYAAAGAKLWRSDDAGRTWSDLTSRLPEGPVVSTALIADPLSPGVVYLGGYSAGRVRVFRSADHGASWQLAAAGLPRSGYRLSLAVHPRRR